MNTLRRRVLGLMSGGNRPMACIAMALTVSGAWAGPAVPGAETPRVVRSAPERDYGPFVYAESDGQIRGLSVELLAAMAPLAGLQVQTLPARDLVDILQGVKAGEVDLASSLRPTPDRSPCLGFSPAYVDIPAVLVLRKGHCAPRAWLICGCSALVSVRPTRWPHTVWAAT